VERGVAAVSLEARADRVLVGLERADGTRLASEAQSVIGAGGAHSVTRASLTEHLDGDTYPGTALVADLGVGCDVPRDGSAFIATPEGYVLLSPLPDERWLTFVGDLDDGEIARVTTDTSLGMIRTLFERRLSDKVIVHDVAWASAFRMQRRLAPRLAMGRRFLLGDAGHLSSPFGGEGLNAGLQDAHDLAWKLALDVRGRSRPARLESFEVERLAAARHVLDVSDRIHQGAQGAVDAARTGVRRGLSSPDQVAALARARCMLDVSYVGSPLLGEHISADVSWTAAPTPGERHPQRTTLGGMNHHLLVCGDADEEAVDRLNRRWGDLVTVVRTSDEPPRRRGVPTSGAVLLRPDGYVGFRAAPAGVDGLAAVDAHLDSYLVPM
jgi:2-polyprenyl-6-methoxyphenol hydroxylase-like FAD-dependent oxidoreductase